MWCVRLMDCAGETGVKPAQTYEMEARADRVVR
jgi:hypothetical protein